jgi:fumarylacetoacetase
MKYLYWNPAQQLCHHTITGCNLRTGDFLGSGTISGPEKNEYGSFLELSWMGKNKIKLENDQERTFWEDNDTIIFTASTHNENYRIGFGECIAKLKP